MQSPRMMRKTSTRTTMEMARRVAMAKLMMTQTLTGTPTRTPIATVTMMRTTIAMLTRMMRIDVDACAGI